MSSSDGIDFSNFTPAELRRLANYAKAMKPRGKPKNDFKPKPKSSRKLMSKSDGEIMTKSKSKSRPVSTPTPRKAAAAMPALSDGMPPVTRSWEEVMMMATPTPPPPSLDDQNVDDAASGSESDGSGDDDQDVDVLADEVKAMEIDEDMEEATGVFGEVSVDEDGVLAWCDEDGTWVEVPALDALGTTQLPKKLPSMKLIKHVLETAKRMNDVVREDFGKPPLRIKNLNSVYAHVRNLTRLPQWQEAQLPSLTSLMWFSKLNVEKERFKRLRASGLGLKRRSSTARRIR